MIDPEIVKFELSCDSIEVAVVAVTAPDQVAVELPARRNDAAAPVSPAPVPAIEIGML